MAGPVTESVDPADSRQQRSRFRFELATAADDADLLRLLRLTPMEGDVRVSLQREPSFFQAAAVEGPDHHVLVVRDTRDDRVVGMGSISIRSRYVAGRCEPVGYLSNLRLLPEYRRGTLLARGYRAMHAWHREHSPARFYLTTIAEGNAPGREALTRGRADLPEYRAIGAYHTLVLPLRRRRSTGLPSGYCIRPLQPQELPCLLEFLGQIGRRREFFPCYTAVDFTSPQRTFLNLDCEHILTAWCRSELIGTLGAWDQCAFRQTIVEGYSGRIAWLRPAYNAWAWCRGRPRFPAAGQPFRYLTGALPLVREGETQVFGALLDELGRRWARRGRDGLLLGLCRHDPLFDQVSRQADFTYVTGVYLVSWDDGPEVEMSADLDLYLELGCL